MKIAVIGGTGLIGSQVVKLLNASGHEGVPHSLSTGVDLLSGQGLPAALSWTADESTVRLPATRIQPHRLGRRCPGRGRRQRGHRAPGHPRRRRP